MLAQSSPRNPPVRHQTLSTCKAARYGSCIGGPVKTIAMDAERIGVTATVEIDGKSIARTTMVAITEDTVVIGTIGRDISAMAIIGIPRQLSRRERL